MPVPAGPGSSSASAPAGGPCSWPLVSCAPAGACPHLDNLSEELREVIIQSATEDLWVWSGRRYGLCSVSIRPCAESCLDARSPYASFRGQSWGFGMYPVISGGQWFNIICGNCGTDRCGCNNLSTIVLPGPVHEITEVLIDGEVLDPLVYRLDNLGLSRVDGTPWQRCQDMASDPTGGSPTNTFMVTYLIGEPVPGAGQLAVGTLACELAKLQCGEKSCRLPRKAQQINREGITIVMPVDMGWERGETGIWEIDRFLARAQRDMKMGYRVSSPDLKPFRRQWPS